MAEIVERTMCVPAANSVNVGGKGECGRIMLVHRNGFEDCAWNLHCLKRQRQISILLCLDIWREASKGGRFALVSIDYLGAAAMKMYS